MSEVITVNLKIWRQEGPDKEGHFEEHAQKITTEASFLEMIDLLNEDLNNQGHEPVSIESDCREGICGTCGAVSYTHLTLPTSDLV